MSAIDDLTTVPAQPEISEGNKTFSQKTYALYVWIRTRLVPAMVELRDLIVNSVTGAYSGVSSSSATITDTGEVSITTDAGRSFKPGTPVRLAYVTDPRIYIDGITKTYNASTGAFVFYAQAKAGTGTYTNWSLSIIPSGGGLAGLGSNTFTGAQYVPDDAYDASSWNGSTAVPTKNSIRDKIESFLATIKNSTNDSSFTSTSQNDLTSPEWVIGLISKLFNLPSKKYVDFTSLRSSGITYTNSTGRAFYISVVAGSNPGGGSISLTVDGLVVFQITNGSTVTNTGSVFARIPDGSTYIVNATSWSISRWMETR